MDGFTCGFLVMFKSESNSECGHGVNAPWNERYGPRSPARFFRHWRNPADLEGPQTGRGSPIILAI